MTAILVTGANGFVGRALCDFLLQHGHNVHGAVSHNDVILNSKISRVTVVEINTLTGR